MHVFFGKPNFINHPHSIMARKGCEVWATPSHERPRPTLMWCCARQLRWKVPSKLYRGLAICWSWEHTTRCGKDMVSLGQIYKKITVFHIKVRLQEGKLWSWGINHPNLCFMMGFIMAPIGPWSWMNLWLSGGLEAGWSVASSIICVPRVSRRWSCPFGNVPNVEEIWSHSHPWFLDLGKFSPMIFPM
jgi:hypothetical protein